MKYDAGTKKKRGRIGILLLLILVFVVISVGVGFGLRWFYAKERDGVVVEFAFRQRAFECGSEPMPAQLYAVLRDDMNVKGVRLYARCEETGDEIELTDDGEKADTLKGDRVYHAQFMVSSATEKELHYVLIARGGSLKIGKPQATLLFYNEESVREELEFGEYTVNRRLDEISSKYIMTGKEEKDAGNYQKTVKQMEDYLSELKKDGLIKDYSFDEPNFVIQYKYGSSVYEFDSGYMDGLESGIGDAGNVSVSLLADRGLDVALIVPYAGDSSKKALPSTDFDTAANTISNSRLGYNSVTKFSGTNASVDVMKNLAAYRVIIINTHGNCNSNGAYFAVCTGSSEISPSDYANGYLMSSSNGKCCITAAFFEHYYEDGALNDCMFYLGACHGADNDILAKTILRKGASCFLAFEHSVFSSYDGKMIKSITKNLIKIDQANKERTITITDAVSAAKKEVGAKDTTNQKQKQKDGKKDAELKLYNANASDPFRLRKNTKSGTLSGKVVSANENNRALPGARVTLSGNGIYRSFFTDNTGSYCFSLPEGQYRISVYYEGYHELVYHANVFPNYTTQLQMFMMVQITDDTTDGIASGKITSALTGYGIDGVNLTVRNGWNNTSGDAVTFAQTVNGGMYYIELPHGNYTIYAELDGYDPMSFNIVSKNGTTTNQNAIMNPDIEGENFRIVLRWGANPRDVDIHIEGPRSNGGTFHTYYQAMTYYENGITICHLDVDDTESYGPETITLIAQIENEPYYCYLHKYAGSGTLASSGSHIEVYTDAGLAITFDVPVNGGDGDYWNVFAIVNGRLVLNNTITSSPDVSYVRESQSQDLDD